MTAPAAAAPRPAIISPLIDALCVGGLSLLLLPLLLSGRGDLGRSLALFVTRPRVAIRAGVGSISPMRRLPLLLLLAACDSPAAPVQPTLEFENGVVFGIPTLPTTAVGGTSGIVVTGVIQTSSTGYSFFPTLRLGEANALTLEIDVQLTESGFSFPTQNFYRARLLTLAPGDYILTVIHQLHEPPPLRRFTVYRDTVRVN